MSEPNLHDFLDDCSPKQIIINKTSLPNLPAQVLGGNTSHITADGALMHVPFATFAPQTFPWCPTEGGQSPSHPHLKATLPQALKVISRKVQRALSCLLRLCNSFLFFLELLTLIFLFWNDFSLTLTTMTGSSWLVIFTFVL